MAARPTKRRNEKMTVTKIAAETESHSLIQASRRQLLIGGAAMASLLTSAGAVAALGAPGDTADFLFVQTAPEMSYADGRLTLKGVSPVTLFFTDRPERIAGNMTTEKFVPFWSEGEDSFLSDPPNADLSILENDTLIQIVVVLKDPVYDGTDLSYAVDIIDGKMPATGKNISVFIDIIGMPLTPVSYAGVARRSFRRAVY